jgi:predicted nucleic acid-binding protein
MQPAVLDSSVYISAFRRRDPNVFSLRRWGLEGPLWLSAVVLEELYAGANEQAYYEIERLEREFDRMNRILLPNLSDWTLAGKMLYRLAAEYKHEQIGRARLTNDALLASSAARSGIRVITMNARDFGRLAELRPFQWQIFSF